MEEGQAPARAGSSLVKKLLREIDDAGIGVGTILRTAKIVAVKLDQVEAVTWIDRELNGYWGIRLNELPDYRCVHGIVRAKRPFGDWEPILWQNSKNEKIFSKVPLAGPIAVIERSLEEATDDVCYTLPPEYRSKIWESIGLKTDIHVRVSISVVHGVVEAVRNRLLDWALELEKAGVVGVDMDFTAKEREEARGVTQTFFIQNAGVAGAVSGHATVTNTQTAAISLDVGAMRALVDQARAQLGGLPDATRAEAEPILDKVERLIDDPEANKAELRGSLALLGRIAENATGNVVAAWIVAVVRSLIGS